MGKPILFESRTFSDVDGDTIKVSAQNPSMVDIMVDSGFVSFNSSAKLRELASAINAAADALQKAQTLTFADLKPGEWFQYAGTPYHKRADDTSYAYAADCRRVCTVKFSDNEPVVRLKATFVPVDEVK